MQTAFLPERGVIRLTGEDPAKFLQGLVTCNVEAIPAGEARFGALLTPQGKIVADFFVVPVPEAMGGGLMIDAPRALVPDLARKLTFYRLRAKVGIEDQSDQLGVTALWDAESAPETAGIVARDPRHPALGWRLISALPATADPHQAAWQAHRVRLGIPEGGRDFAYGDAFPHEADMDQLAGVDFAKGCYVGQEVVSRMQHRGTARTRVVPFAYPDHAPMEGIDVMAGGKAVGTMGSAAGGRALAKVRLDRIEDALAAGDAITAGGIALTPSKPDWARFAWPGEVAATT
ncbi:MAG: folate-binding protein YgfZ [Phreatobacter sp.]|uniref:CAF17-like 4Fe-4S cluster assembly/insertion protein YgfZ n=1 Tax=Phreatobacter sp. TaxID=1966341 RepID=UPI001A49175C|nr:folate-binding protein [Phreatobacter sp.]MBL8568976.1 folate-binding protein YgfZ [Phreatobacter sp.]